MIGSVSAPPPYPHVVVATDGSPLSETALVGGAMLAARTSADLHVFHASSDPGTEESVVCPGCSIAAKSAVQVGDQGPRGFTFRP